MFTLKLRRCVMRKLLTKKMVKGFTLVELLVVIAIIGILAGMLFPAIAGAMVSSKATKVGNDGKQIWLALYTVSTDKEALNEAPVWPKTQGVTYGSTANDFFVFAMDKTNLWLEGFGPSMVSAPGLSAATSWSNMPADSVAWSLVGDLKSGANADTPFMLTKNFKNALSKLNAIDGLDETKEPFGSKLGVVVTWGGAVRILKDKQCRDIQSTQKYVNPNDNKINEILEATSG